MPIAVENPQFEEGKLSQDFEESKKIQAVSMVDNHFSAYQQQETNLKDTITNEQPGEGNVLDNIDAENLNDRDNQEIDVVPLASPVEETKTDSDDEADNILRVSTDNTINQPIDELLEVDSPESPLSDDEPVLTTPKYNAVPT